MFTKYTKLCAIVYNQCAVKGMKLSSQDLGKTWATDFKKQTIRGQIQYFTFPF